MPLLDLRPSGIALEARDQDSKMPTIIGLTLNDSVIDQLLHSVMKKETLELTLGNDPKITFGDMTQRLTSSYDPFYTEIYCSPYTNPTKKNSDQSTTSDMPAKKSGFQAMFMKGNRNPIRTVLIDKNGKETRKDPVTAGADLALASLQASMATMGDEKKAKQTKAIKAQDAMATKKGNKNRFLNSHGSSFVAGGTTRSMPSSPSLGGVGSPRQAPTSVLSASELAAEKTKAIRSPIIHVLAAEPSTGTRLHRLKKDIWTEAEFQVAIDKVADRDGNVYVLRQKMYKELDVWKYPYLDPEDRQKAIDNAVKAYDKMRMESAAVEWERLLPKEERGTGKCLSKLQVKIATGTAKPPKINLQKPDGVESGVDSAADDGLGDLKSEGMARSNSQPPHTKHKKASEKELQAKRLLGKGGIVKSQPKNKKVVSKVEEKFLSSAYIEDSDEELAETVASPARPVTTGKPASKPKTTGTKKTTPAPAKSSHKRISSTNSSSGSSDTPIAKRWMSERKSKQPTNAASTAKPNQTQPGKSSVPKNPVIHKRKSSDQDHEPSTVPAKKSKVSADDTVVVKKPTASSNPPRPAHRVSDASKTSTSSSSSSGINATNASGRPRSGTQKSSPLGMSPPTNASEIDDAYQSSSSTDKSAASIAGRISSSSKSKSTNGTSKAHVLEQPKDVLDMARKFKLCYEKYLKDYRELEACSGSEKRGDSYRRRVEELCEMHERLRVMKEFVVGGYVRA